MTVVPLSPVLLTLIIACCTLFLIQLAFVLGIYNRIHQACKKLSDSPADSNTPLPPLSVIIVTKDTGKVLEENLSAILEQDYPQFEVIVVNDQSAGEDENILKRMEGKYHHLYRTFIPQTARYISRKKLGIAMGIKASRYEWIVVTEPYCRPVSPNWLRSLASHFTPETDIVLGYSNYFPAKGCFARRLIADTLFHSMRYLGMALAGKPYMGIGRNLAYRKRIYENHKGFSDQLVLQRGEDDLFINSVANSYNTQVAVHPDSIVRMPIPPYKRIWFEEKIGEHVTGHLYHGWARFSNAFETRTCALFHLITLAGLILSIISFQWIATGVFFLLGLIRFIIQMIVFRNTAKDMQEKLCCVFPVFDLFRPLLSLQLKLLYFMRAKSDFLRK